MVFVQHNQQTRQSIDYTCSLGILYIISIYQSWIIALGSRAQV